MKKNWLTVIVLALSILNLLLTTVIVFTMVPNTINTNKLISKVASSIDFEVESLKSKDDGESSVKFEDLDPLALSDDITINLKDTNGKKAFALLSATLSLNSKGENFSKIKDKIVENDASIREIIRDEFAKYNATDARTYKDAIKEDALVKVQELLGSDDVVVGISLGKFVVDAK